MEEEVQEYYRVEVLHYLNPHLIWVEVLQSSADSSKSYEDFFFEQIGIYGILPLQTTIDVMDMSTKPCISRDWQSSIVQCMTQIIEEAAEVWFRPICIDVKNSIFDDNIHKYGEVMVKTKGGKFQNLSSILINKKFAHRNESMFSKELFNFKLNTKLDDSQIKKVIKTIEKYYKNKEYPKNHWEKSVHEHTTVFHEAYNLKSTLTKNNLKLHNLVHEKPKKIDDILVHKFQDFDLCKNINEMSVGRGDIPHKNPIQTILTKKLNLKNLKQQNAEVDYGTTTKIMEPEHILVEKLNLNQTSVKTEEICSNEDVILNSVLKKAKKKTSKKLVLPKFDVKTEKIVVYGPPNTDCSKLCPKVVKVDTEGLEISQDIITHHEELPKEKNCLEGLDSEVNFSVENKDSLKRLLQHCNNFDPDNIICKEEETKKSVYDTPLFVEQKHNNTVKNCVLQKKLHFHQKKQQNESSQSSSTREDSKNNFLNMKVKTTNYDSDNETTLTGIIEKLNLTDKTEKLDNNENESIHIFKDKNHVNPFKNLDESISKFVDKLVSPILMVHSKDNKRIQPLYELRDVSFGPKIFSVLTEMSIKHPMILQTVSWSTILRGCSLFMISPLGSGKTLGYTPAVCRLVADFDKSEVPDSLGPICIIVCATTKSVIEIEKQCRRFLGHNKTVLGCYADMDKREITTSLLNGCDIMICTPLLLVKLLNDSDFGVDLRRLSTCVLDDCERLKDIYMGEVRFTLLKIKSVLKNRTNKELKIQYIVASRVWCDFFSKLSKYAPKSVICINSFQECVVYAEAPMSVSLVKRENKVASVLDFIKSNDVSKRSVIVCNLDSEVEIIAEVLIQHKYTVFTANDTMTVEELYNLCAKWTDYEEPILGPILVCCDDNLIHLNITNSHYLLHFSLPKLFSMFCRRFSVLIDHYPSIFKEEHEFVKIKILLDENNTEQLPKILNFIKRCTNDTPNTLDSICEMVLTEKDLMKAKNLVPFCDNTLALGQCPDYWNCKERHTLFQNFDEPDEWVPKTGIVSFRILHYHTPVSYSARLISNNINGKLNKYPQTYSSLSLKLGLFYSKECNKKLHGIPRIGDICAVALKPNFFERCQVVKIVDRYYNNGNPNVVIVKLIDEEKWEKTRDIYLYYLPDEFKNINSHVVHVKLANIQPKDKDITFSDLSKQKLMTILGKDEDMYVSAKILMTIGNCLIVDNAQACQDLTSIRETVVRYNLREELLKLCAISNSEHIPKLQKICERDGLILETQDAKVLEPKQLPKNLPQPRWAHLESDDVQLVCLASSKTPDLFFVRHQKFEECLNNLIKDIQKHIGVGNPDALTFFQKDNIVLAKFPDDSLYYRAIIHEILDSQKVSCFFVDYGDWREVQNKDIVQITESFITRMPFQAIECRLVGLKPGGNSWTEFSSGWFGDQFYVFKSDDFCLKDLYVKYFTKDKAEYTGGYKYGIVIIDTTTDQDIVINKLMIDLNLARLNEDEAKYLEDLDFKKKEQPMSDSGDEENISKLDKGLSYQNQFNDDSFSHDLSGFESSDDEWDVEMNAEDFKSIFKQPPSNASSQDMSMIPTSPSTLPINSSDKDIIAGACSIPSQLSDYEIIQSPKGMIQELDSDDLSSPENSKIIDLNQLPKKVNGNNFSESVQLRKPKVCWHQSKTNVTIKIELIGVEDYVMEIVERSLKFKANVRHIDYGFEINLYGVIDPNKSTHAPKGLCVYVKLAKMFKKNWLSLTKDEGGVNKWIMYDPDSIDTSSDEDDDKEHKHETLKKIIENTHYVDSDDDKEEDEDFVDDTDFKYRH